MLLNLSNAMPVHSLASLLLIGLCGLTSCGGGGSGQAAEVPQTGGGGGTVEPAPKGLLVALASPDQFKQQVTAGFQDYYTQRSEVAATSEGGDAVQETSGDTDTGASDTIAFTTTYTLEANVDEYDVVKYNGSQLFIAPSRGMDCCFVFEDEVAFELEADAVDSSGDDATAGSDAVGSGDGASDMTEALAPPERGIRILTTDAENGLAQETDRIPLTADQSVEGLYLVDNNLIALTSTAWWGRHGDNFATPERWVDQSVELDIFDLDNRFERRHSFRVEGALVNSRRTEAGIFLVTRHTPAIDGLIYDPVNQQEIDQNQNL